MDEKLYGTEKLPLSHFEGMTREQIEAMDGVGPRTADQIEAALRGDETPQATPAQAPEAPKPETSLVEGGVVTQVRVPGGTY